MSDPPNVPPTLKCVLPELHRCATVPPQSTVLTVWLQSPDYLVWSSLREKTSNTSLFRGLDTGLGYGVWGWAGIGITSTDHS